MGAGSADGILVITVVRTGGFAGLRQEWETAVADSERNEWMPLIDACPWRSVASDPTSRDRFVWRIEVRAPRFRRSATVPDVALEGPWRALVSRVRGEVSPEGS